LNQAGSLILANHLGRNAGCLRDFTNVHVEFPPNSGALAIGANWLGE
jgi:hypothetical protein